MDKELDTKAGIEVSNTSKEESKNTQIKLAQATYSFLPGSNTDYPYSPSDVDKLDLSKDDNFKEVIKQCRFFYKKEPYAATIINKMIDISIGELVFDKNSLSDNEFRVFSGIQDQLREFAEQIALEYLLSGLVVPEIKFGPANKDKLKDLGIKKYDTLELPISMWVRDPSTITINKTILSDIPSYFLHVPDDLISFIINKGTYSDGTKDPDLYTKLLTYYPTFVAQINKGEREILLDIDPSLVLRRRVTTESAYPTPYLYAALEAMRHKRNLRRMDYSIAARVISAIMLVRLGDKDFPITEDDKEAFTAIKDQLLWRDSSNRNTDRIFQLFANHTLQIDWKYPPTEALLNTAKYESVNEDIVVSLGFPRILITGEAQRSQTSDASYATSSPVKTMEMMRSKILVILNYVSRQIAKLNSFKAAPTIRFRPLQLAEYSTFMAAITQLYQSGNLSRESYAELLGYSWDDEIANRIEEEKFLKDSGLPEFAPTPNSRVPQNTNNQNPDNQNPTGQNDGKGGTTNNSPQDQQKGQNPTNQQKKQQAASIEDVSAELNSSIKNLIAEMKSPTPITVMMPEQQAPVVNVTMPEQKESAVNIAMPEQQAPVINITMPEQQPPVVNNVVNIPPAEVTVNVPPAEVTVNNQPADVTVNVPPADVKIDNQINVPETKVPEPKTEKITVNRDSSGKITSMEKNNG